MDQGKDKIFIYWIESHKANEEMKAFIENNGEKIKMIPIYKTDEILTGEISSVFCYVIPKIIFELIFISEFIANKNKNTCNKISLDIRNETNEHYFIYDFVPLNNFSHIAQFELYLKMIDNKFNKDQSMIKNIKEMLFINSRNLLKKTKEYFDFMLYISVLVESYYYENFIGKYIMSYLIFIKNKDKYKEIRLTPIKNQRLEEMKNIINFLAKTPENILYMVEEHKKQNVYVDLYEIILLFDLHFQRDKLLDILRDKNINKTLFEILFKKKKIYASLQFSTEELIGLLQCVNNFEEVEIILSFNHNFVDILIAISTDYEIIQELFKASDKKKTINLENFIVPKEEDNLYDIISYYSSILNLDIENHMNKRIISISPKLIGKYVEYNDFLNYTNLLHLKKLIETIQKIEKDFKVDNFYHILHETGIEFIIKKKFSNDDILNFIMDDIFYNPKYKYIENLRVLAPLEEINLEKMTRNDIDLWKKIDWLTIFKQQRDNFFNTIISLVKSLKDFEKIFDILIENALFKTYKITIINLVKEKLINEYKNEPRESLIKNMHIIKQIVKYSTDTNYSTDFIEKIRNYFDKNFVSILFATLYNEENENIFNMKKLPDKVYKFIEDYIDKEIKSEEPEKLFNLIKIISKNNSKIFNKLKKYIFDEKAFFTLEENVKIKLLRLLIIGGILPSKNSKNLFLQKSYENIENVKNKIINFKFSFNDIDIFFEKEENILLFKERFGLLYLININDKDDDGRKYDDNFEIKKKDIDMYIDKIKISSIVIKNDINSIELIINDFIIFYPVLHKNDVEEFKSLIVKYKNKSFLEKDMKIEEIKMDYLAGAQQRLLKKDSILFKSIYEQEKVISNNDETKSLIEAEKKFEEARNVLYFDKLDEKLLKICLEEFKNKTKKEIKNELEKLVEIFQVKNINIEELANNYELLAYKENIINVAKATKLFIEETKAIKSNYYNNLDTIISFCENNYDIEVINMFLDLLQDIGIDLKNKKNKFSNVLIALEKNKESVNFLLTKTLADCANLHGIVNNGEEDSFLTSADIIHFEKCINFMNNLGTADELKKMTDYDLIMKAEKLFNELEDKNSDIYFFNFSEQYQKIKELLKQEFNKSEALRQIIDNICKESKFTLSNKEKNYFEGIYKIQDEEDNNENDNDKNNKKRKPKEKLNQLKEVSFKELQDLNIKIQITKKITSNTEDKIKIFNDFTELINNINNIFYLLNEIYIRGYTKEIEVSIIINNFIKHFEIEIHEPEDENNKNKNEKNRKKSKKKINK